MNWFKKKQWKKIGEAQETENFENRLYAVMEHIKSNGDREYKKVLICKWGFYTPRPRIDSAPEDPLREINDILKS